jgi:hypothetical protein
MAEDEDAPATKKDLAELKTVLKTDLAELEARLEAKFDTKFSEIRDSITEQIRDNQTEILKAFLPWQESVQTQFRKLEADMGNNVVSIQQRMNILERRLWEIEKRLLMNPPAA